MLMTCSLHQITYNSKLDPTCPQCSLAGVMATQAPAVPGIAGAPPDETLPPLAIGGPKRS